MIHSDEEKCQDNENIVTHIRINIATMKAQILHLERSNKEILAAVKSLRIEQENRFKWTIVLVISLIVAFSSLLGFLHVG